MVGGTAGRSWFGGGHSGLEEASKVILYHQQTRVFVYPLPGW